MIAIVVLTLRITRWDASARVRHVRPNGTEPLMEDHSGSPEDPHDSTSHWKALVQLGAPGSEWDEARKQPTHQTPRAGTEGATLSILAFLNTPAPRAPFRHFTAGETAPRLP